MVSWCLAPCLAICQQNLTNKCTAYYLIIKNLANATHTGDHYLQRNVFLRKDVPTAFKLLCSLIINLFTCCNLIALKMALLIWQQQGCQTVAGSLIQHLGAAAALLVALFADIRNSVEIDCLQAVVVSVVERRDETQLVEEGRMKQGFVCLAKRKPDLLFSNCSVLCLIVSACFLGF